MLELKNIKKSYKTGTFIQHALNDIDLCFRKKEFVAILGPSGSGKTTLLNIIGGLDRYDSGNLLIKGKSTKSFKDKDWDAYRNKSIGFVFQNYNLISHISILDNIEMGLTLSGKSSKYRRKKAKELLKKVGLEEHAHKKPNQLSGGQMQRVAIARSLANDPEIILADEPTGALDTKTSKQIMNLIKEIAKDKLVIMVTHNPELAEEYADRIIKMIDGKIESDSNPVSDVVDSDEYKLKRTKMSFFTALHLSFNNIRTKKGRTLLTAFASSIGIIGIAIILALSNGFQNKIVEFEHDVSDAMPIIILANNINTDAKSIISSETGMDLGKTDRDFTSEKKIYKDDKILNSGSTTSNAITDEFIKYLEDMPSEYISSYNINKYQALNLIQKKNNEYFFNVNHIATFPIPTKGLKDDNVSDLFDKYYDVLAGHIPNEKDEVLIEVNKDNSLDPELIKFLGLEGEEISFNDVLESKFKLVFNDDLYEQYQNFYITKTADEQLYNNENNLEIKVVGIIRVKEDQSGMMGVASNNNVIYYTKKLQDYFIEKNKDSKIVKEQEKIDVNIFTNQAFADNKKENEFSKSMYISIIGGDNLYGDRYLYPKDFEATDKIIEYLNDYNKNKKEEDKVKFVNQAELVNNMTGSIMDGITAVLIAFSSISLVVSSIMLGIITYISVLERTKEIGILRSLGARKKDIKRVFNAETTIIGLSSGILGIIIASVLIIPINMLLKNLTSLDNVAVLNPIHAIILITISIVLTLIGGTIPAHIASKQDPVASLRTE